jgi:hypothetical protein
VLAGPIAAAVGVSVTQYGAAALIIVVSLLALIPREIRQLRAGHLLPDAADAASQDVLPDGPADDDAAVPDPAAAPAGAGASAGAAVR